MLTSSVSLLSLLLGIPTVISISAEFCFHTELVSSGRFMGGGMTSPLRIINDQRPKFCIGNQRRGAESPALSLPRKKTGRVVWSCDNKTSLVYTIPNTTTHKEKGRRALTTFLSIYLPCVCCFLVSKQKKRHQHAIARPLHSWSGVSHGIVFMADFRRWLLRRHKNS